MSRSATDSRFSSPGSYAGHLCSAAARCPAPRLSRSEGPVGILTRCQSAARNCVTAVTSRTAIAALGQRKRFDPRQVLVICADPRGGSTWLAEILSNIPRTTLLWEPLHVGSVPHFRKIGFGWRHYIPADAEAPEAREMFERLFSGVLLDPYIVHRTRLRQLRHANRALVKFCRATQLLPWLTGQFSFENKPVHLIRHPCAVVASQIQHGAWSGVSPRFTDDEILSQPLLASHLDKLRRISTMEGRLAAIWALVNGAALNYPGRHARWMTISYEGLLNDPEDTVSRILTEWGLTVVGEIPNVALRPSGTTLDASPIQCGKVADQAMYWKRILDRDQVRQIVETVEAFGVNIYGEGILPDRSVDAA